MKRLILSLALTASLTSCGVVPITGRNQLSLVSDSEVLAMSQQQYLGFISQARSQGVLVRSPRVEGIVQRLVVATDDYLRRNQLEGLRRQMAWEVNVVNSKQINAFCMPGGKIVVYTGLINMLGQSAGADAELAAVLGHEISHALARHANERLSNAMLTQMGGQVLGSVVGAQSAALSNLFNIAYGLGTGVFVSLPFGRKQEYEADQMGVALMAMAGYDPRYAVSLWEKMARASGGNKNEFLSTHPSEANRIRAIQSYLPKVMPIYQQATGQRVLAPSGTSSSRPATSSGGNGFRYELPQGRK